MDDLFGPVSTSTATTPENRWKTLAESNIIYETFGINVVPAYMEIGDIPTLHEANAAQDEQAKQQLLNFCNMLLRTRQMVTPLRCHRNGREVMWSRKL